MFTEFIEKLDFISSYSYSIYSKFSTDPNYFFEIFALNHTTDKNGELSPPDYQCIENISDWIIYIEQRALVTQNRVVRSRYNDLLWFYKRQFDNSLLTDGNVRDKCEIAISDYIYLAEKYILLRDSDDNLIQNLRNYLYRAWNLNKQIIKNKSNQQHNPILIQLMIDIENSIDEDSKIALWGFSFDKLVHDNSVILSLEQENSIIDKIDSRIKRLDFKDYYALEHGVKLLLKYYRNNPLKQAQYLDLLEKNAHIESNHPFQNQHRFKNLIKLCQEYGFKERREQATLNYHLYGKDNYKYMAKIEQSFEITPEMKQELIDSLSDDNPREHFLNIANSFISSKSSIKEQHLENKKHSFFKDAFTTDIIDNNGVTIKTLTTRDDELFHENILNWQINSTFLSMAITNFIEKHQLSEEKFKDLIFDEMLYKNQESTLLAAINALYNKDYYAMCYISIPLIENGLRQLLFQCDHSIYEEKSHKGFENIALSRILQTLEIYIKEDIIFHLKFVLNEKAALNLRNSLSHGLLSDSEINETIALTLLHVHMILKYIVGFSASKS